MSELGPLLERVRDAVEPKPDAFRRLAEHRRRRSRNQRLGAAAVALAVAAAGLAVAVRAFRGPEAPPARPAATVPPVDPRVAQTIATEGWANAVVDGFGSVWVTESADDGSFGGRLLRLDPATGDVQARIAVETLPGWEWSGEGVAIGDGSIWIGGGVETSDGGSQAAVVRVDPQANEAVETILLGGELAADVEVGQGAIWVSVFAGDGRTELLRVDPATGEVVARIELASSYSRNVLLAAGAVWVQEYRVDRDTVGGSVLTRIDPDTNAVTGRVAPGGFAKFAVWDDDVWALTKGITEGGFLRIDPATATAGGDPVPVGEDPTSGGIGEQVSSTSGANLAPGAGGLWFIQQEHGDLTLSRFVPSTGEVDASVVLPDKATPIAMAVSGDSIWLVDYHRKLTRIELQPGSLPTSEASSAESLATDPDCGVVNIASDEYGLALEETSGAPGDEIVISGTTYRDEGGRWAPSPKLEVWWNTRVPASEVPGGDPIVEGPVLLLAREDDLSGCMVRLSFTVPDVPPGRYRISYFFWHEPASHGYGFGLPMTFEVTEA